MTGWRPAASAALDEADRPVQAAVVRDGQPGQAQLDGPFHEVVRGRGAIEEREVRVAVEFGVRGRVPRVAPVGGRLSRGQVSIEHLF